MQLSSNSILELPLLGGWGPDAVQDEKSEAWKNSTGASTFHPTSLYFNNVAWTNSKSSKSQSVCNTEYQLRVGTFLLSSWKSQSLSYPCSFLSLEHSCAEVRAGGCQNRIPSWTDCGVPSIDLGAQTLAGS